MSFPKGTVIVLKRRHPLANCAACLYRVGFGYTSMSRMLRKNKNLCRKWVMRSRASQSLKRSWSGIRKPMMREAASEKAIRKMIAVSSRLFKDKAKPNHRAYYAANRKRIRAWQNAYFKHPTRKIVRAMRLRTWKTIKEQGGKKRISWTRGLLGCSKQELMTHLQSLFRVGMSWSNYGIAWEVDHIKPCSRFDLTDESQQRLCFHYSNLQPMDKSENRRKHNSMVWPRPG